MAFTSKNSLVELINSLSTNEKRYLKQSINNSRETQSNHAKLLNAIIKQKDYDEEQLKKQLKNTSIIKQWSRVKNYLYHYILRILQTYYQQNAEFEILNNLQYIFILYKKGIYEEAYRLLVKTKSLVYEGSYPTLLPFIADWEIRMGNIAYYYENETINFEKNNQWAIEIANNLLFYKQQSVKTSNSKLKKGRYLHMKDEHEATLNKTIYSSLEKAKSPMAKWLFLVTKSNLYAQQGEYIKAFYEAKECMHLHETYPLLEKQAPLSYITAINSFIVDAIETKNWGEISFILKKVDLYIKENKASPLSVLLTSIKHNALLKISILQMNYTEALKHTAVVETFVTKNKHVTNMYVQAHLLLHYSTHIYVVHGAYKKALIIIDELEKIQKIPIYRNAMSLLKLICLFEQDEILLLPYTLRSVYRNFLKKKDLYGIERIILNLLKASIKAASKNELLPIFQKYLVQLQEYIAIAPKEELDLLEHFNYVAWVESKVVKRPLIVILKEHSKISN